ncbi:GAF and ANTAR domain-containing protein [Amycolatopsis mediterranei]|nr:GAF and ANTAR domain-containing protein [Amycolatopsis mediterranei]UZF73271.1 GAF and ANTAR domain-containing protein [Amycolatopsis mediterranei]
MTELEGLHTSVLAALGRNAADGGIDLLGRVCRECVRLLSLDGAAIAVMAHAGQRELVHATDVVSTALADLQFALGEGPGFEAYTSGDAVLVPDLGADFAPAWPIFAVEAATHPVAALFSFPVHLGGIAVATLDAYRGTPGSLSNGDLVTAGRLADLAALALSGLSANAGRWLDGDGSRMSGSGMRYRQVSQATGMVMAVLDLPPAAALARIRAYAFACGRSLLDVASDIVTRQLQPAEVADPEPR